MINTTRCGVGGGNSNNNNITWKNKVGETHKFQVQVPNSFQLENKSRNAPLPHKKRGGGRLGLSIIFTRQFKFPSTQKKIKK
jgi:hypothetical protein